MVNTPQYAILRFAKYKEPEISQIEGHNERTKEKYNSNPDIDNLSEPLSCDSTENNTANDSDKNFTDSCIDSKKIA